MSFTILAISLLLGGIGCMKQELSERDKSLLADIEQFNATVGESGWHISDVIIENEDLSHIRLNNSSIRNAEWIGITIQEGMIQNTSFKGVTFNSPQFSDSEFTNVQFTDCTFRYARFLGVRLTKCVFTNCKLEANEVENSLLRDCQFVGTSDDRSVFRESELHNSSFKDCVLENTSFYSGMFETITFSDSKINSVTFYDTKSHSIRFDGSTLNYTTFAKGVGEGIKFENCNSDEGLTFVGAEISDVKFERCNDLKLLTVDSSVCHNLHIHESRGLLNPAFNESKVYDLSISNSELSYFVCEESEVGNNSVISNSIIRGLSFAASKVVGLTIENSTVAEFLVLKGARFEKLTIKHITYGRPIEILDENVIYIDSDTFSEP